MIKERALDALWREKVEELARLMLDGIALPALSKFWMPRRGPSQFSYVTNKQEAFP